MNNIELIKKMRFYTNLSLFDCKRALINADWDFDKALYEIKKIGKIKYEKDLVLNHANKGIIISSSSGDYRYAFILQLKTQSDFVLKNDNIKILKKKIIENLILYKIKNIKELYNLINEDIIYFSNIFKENISINNFNFLEGNYVYSYVHLNKIGVLILLKDYTNKKDIIKNISMQIISNKPKYIYENENSNVEIQKELNFITNIEKENNNFEENKIKYILNNKIENFKKEKILSNQNYMFDEKKTILEILNENNIYILDFILSYI